MGDLTGLILESAEVENQAVKYDVIKDNQFSTTILVLPCVYSWSESNESMKCIHWMTHGVYSALAKIGTTLLDLTDTYVCNVSMCKGYLR